MPLLYPKAVHDQAQKITHPSSAQKTGEHTPRGIRTTYYYLMTMVPYCEFMQKLEKYSFLSKCEFEQKCYKNVTTRKHLVEEKMSTFAPLHSCLASRKFQKIKVQI